MQKIATLTGHTYRVLYLALSPDGSTIVTGAGDETLRFWQVFPGPQKENKAGGLLFPAGMPGSVIRQIDIDEDLMSGFDRLIDRS